MIVSSKRFVFGIIAIYIVKNIYFTKKEVLKLKKTLKKKFMSTENAVRYFSGETMNIANMGTPGNPTPCVTWC